MRDSRRPTVRGRRLGVGLVAAGFAVSTVVVSSQALAEPGDPIVPPASGAVEWSPEQVNGWFVELAGEPVARGGRQATLDRQHQRFADRADAAGVDLAVRHRYQRAWNGVAADLSSTDAAKLTSLSEVVAVYPILTVEAPEPDPDAAPEMANALGLTGADVAQSELGYTGEGLKVGVIDTGVDYDHPDLGGSGTDGGTAFPTDRVVAGHDFVGDDFNADASSPAYQPEPQPDDDPDDCHGHGTHVAGIVGADGDVRGVAPEVQFGAYRVFGCGGSTTADVIVAALERAHADDMDVVNMSIGSAFSTWPQYPTAAASDALVDDGVVVVASIGNSGADGVWSAGAPGVGEKVIGVASFDNTKYDAAMFTVSPDDLPVAYTIGSEVPPPPTEGTVPLAATGTPETVDDACEPIADDLSGSIALVQRGECFFYVKAFNAWQAGAEAVVIYNNVAGGFSPSLAPPSAEDPPIEIPVVAITNADGVELHDRISAGETELTWTEETLTVENPTAGLISSFSSFGLTADLQVKPDLGAPGGLINSTYPLESGGQAVSSGTSMASPHVAGAVALLLQAKPDLAAAEVRDVLQNTAAPAELNLAPGSGFLEPVHRQGAGMLAIDDAITATATITPGKLALGESAAGPATRSVTLTNDGAEPVTYALGNADAVSTAGVPSTPGYYLGGAQADFGAESVTVPAGGSAEVTVTITAPGGPEHAVYGGYLTFTPEEGEPLRVPYAGFVGDYQAVDTMTEGAFGFPFLASLTECERLIGVDCTMNGAWDTHPTGGVSYSMTDGDFPTLLVHLDYPARSLEVRLHEANPDGSKGDRVGGVNNTVLTADFIGRSADQGAFTPYVWDGTREKSRGKGGNSGGTQQVPDGDYVLEVVVLQALGDAANPDHVETWTSPAFTVDRP